MVTAAVSTRPIGRRRGRAQIDATDAGRSSAGASDKPRQRKATNAKSRSRCRGSGTRTMSALAATTLPVMCGSTPPTARRPIWPCSSAAARSRNSSGKSPEAGKCRRTSPAATPQRPGALARPARLRRPEMPARAHRPHRRHGPRPREDRPG